MKLFPISVIFFFLVSCATTVGVEYNYKTDFSVYKTYNYNPENDSGFSQLEDKYIHAIMDSLLPQRGFSKSESPQVYVNFYVNEKEALSKNTVTIGFIPIGKKVRKQEFVFEFLNAESQKVLWKAIAQDELKLNASPAKKREYFTELLQEILLKYPPKNK